MREKRDKKQRSPHEGLDGSPAMLDEEPFDVGAVNPRYGTAQMSNVELDIMCPRDPMVAAIIEARRDELADI